MNSTLPIAPAEPVSRIVSLKVFVRALRVEAEIGVNANEDGRRQPLVIDAEADLAPPERCEHIGETLNYEAVLRKARQIADSGHVRLIESFAQRLAEAVLHEPHVVRVRIRIEKPEALAPHAEAAGVEITLTK